MGSVTFSDSFTQSYIGSGSYDVKIDFSETYTQSTNKTSVRITGIAIRKNDNSANYGDMPVFGSVQVAGVTLVSVNGSPCYANMSGTSWRPLTGWSSGSVDVQHNDAGACTTTFKITAGNTQNGCTLFGAFLTRAAFGVRTASKSVALTTHPRASGISSSSSSVATQGTYSLTVSRNSNAFYHKATFGIDGTTLAESSAFAASLNCTVPRAWLGSFPNDVSKTVTVSVQTYTDSSCTTAVGSAASTTFTLTADADMKPSVSAGWVSIAAYNTGAVSGLSGFIKGYSRAAAVFDSHYIDLSDTAGASIASCSVTCQGVTVSESPYRTPVLTQNSLVCTVTDTRGRTASETFTVTLLDYAAPTLTDISVFRCDVNGDADEDGGYYSAKATLIYSSLNGRNACSLTAAHKAAGGAYGTAANLTSGTASVIGTISPDLTYTVKLSATDALGNTAEFYSTLATRKWAMHFRPNGRGAAFGKAAERDGVFEIASDWGVKLGQPLPVTSGGTGADNEADARANLGILDYIYPVGSIYMSVSSTNPAALFGGTWAAIEDRFLLSAGSVYTAGDTGGEAAHTLTKGELPAEQLGIQVSSTWLGYQNTTAGAGNNIAGLGAQTGTALKTEEMGSGNAHNNMPPYLVVYMWKRTA